MGGQKWHVDCYGWSIQQEFEKIEIDKKIKNLKKLKLTKKNENFESLKLTKE